MERSLHTEAWLDARRFCVISPRQADTPRASTRPETRRRWNGLGRGLRIVAHGRQARFARHRDQKLGDDGSAWSALCTRKRGWMLGGFVSLVLGKPTRRERQRDQKRGDDGTVWGAVCASRRTEGQRDLRGTVTENAATMDWHGAQFARGSANGCSAVLRHQGVVSRRGARAIVTKNAAAADRR